MAEQRQTGRMPVVYIPHGGGPWPFVDLGPRFGYPSELETLAEFLRGVADAPAVQPRAVLVVSAHWEETVPTVMTAAAPPMLYDYYGFPPESYRIEWPAPGAPDVAAEVRALLAAAGFESAEDDARGFDHGTFVPLKLMYPDAAVPTFQLSLKRGLDPATHLAVGRALAPLRDRGVFIVGSGLSYHNLRAFGPAAAPASEAFDAWLQETVRATPVERDARLVEWAEAPEAREVHPREEHLLPLMVAAGAAGDDVGRVSFEGRLAGLQVSAAQFG
ncbi:MAG: dioxygenase [Myxococcales bacterium]|nr:dioxygenase [Myxococcales bacterium]